MATATQKTTNLTTQCIMLTCEVQQQQLYSFRKIKNLSFAFSRFHRLWVMVLALFNLLVVDAG